MNSTLKFALLGIFSMGLAVGCKNEPQQIAPAKEGERNSSCRAKNDCADGLSCIFGRCSPTDFEFNASGKECNIVQCETTADCCGTNPQELSPECESRATVCSPTLPGCSSGFCTEDTDCGGGTCSSRFCSASSFSTCSSDADCPADTCGLGGTCTLSGVFCATDADCTTPNTCGTGSCNCSNPNYDAFDPICTDDSCDELCVLKCDERMCVPDTACETDTDCFGVPGDMCVAGACIDCEMNEDCDEDNEEQCVAGFCEKPCKFNEECDQFEACEAGECVYKGCSSDIECALDPATNVPEPRLLRCMPGSDGFNECKLPCEVDAHCVANQICTSGFCEDIGCANDADCATIAGTSNQTTTKQRPYVSKGICEAATP